MESNDFEYFSNSESDTIALGKKLAHASGFEEELGMVQKLHGGDLLLSSSQLSRGW